MHTKCCLYLTILKIDMLLPNRLHACDKPPENSIRKPSEFPYIIMCMTNSVMIT